MNAPRQRGWLTALLLPVGVVVLALLSPTKQQAAPPDPQGYLFCFWNVEDLFDDKVNSYHTSPDRECDAWFARDDKARKQKYDNLANVLAGLNGGKGPDILAVAEVESLRAAELLAEAINVRLKNPELRYKTVLFKDPQGGRNIATAVITRLPVVEHKTQLLGRRLRILETHLKVGGNELVILATHWTSRVSDDKGDGRARYADLIYANVSRMAQFNPRADVLICGDFNDNPDDASVRDHLHAVSDVTKVKPVATDPLLFNLFGKRWQEIQAQGKREGGTHVYRGKPYIFDQIVISPGLLDREGWTCLIDTAEVVTTGEKLVDRRKAPLRFGGEREKIALEDRGCSDHLPVTVRLRVASK
jgi:endonuclease/exonuclease/phosphatase family metal-dependent hydrolase